MTLRGRRRAAFGLVTLFALLSCGGGAEGSDDPETSSVAPTTTSTLDIAGGQAVAGQVAATGQLAGLAEMAEHRDDLTGTAIAEDDATSGSDCAVPGPDPDPRLVRVRRVFGSATVPPAADFAEIDQTTTVFSSPEAREVSMQATMDALAGCPRSVNREHDQVTEGWAEVPPPAEVADVGLDTRLLTATMTVQSNGRAFPHSYGCVGRGVVLQCIAVWTMDRAASDQHLAVALAATAQGLAAADVPA